MMQFDITHEAQTRYQTQGLREMQRDCFIEGAGWAQNKMIYEALEFFDEFLRNGGTKDDWFNDKQCRLDFIKRMHN